MTDKVDTKTGEVVVEAKPPMLSTLHSVAAVAAAEQARALVQARVLMAKQMPRDMDRVLLQLLNHCKRPRFAEAARYAKPIGGGAVTGWSVRFAEDTVRTLGNIDVHTIIVSDTEEAIVIRVVAIDLETNSGFGGEIVIQKTVERRQLRGDEVALSVRTNSQGKPTYTVRATEDDMLTKIGAHISKAIRTYALRLVPADILDECAAQIAKTLDASTKQVDPAQVRKRIIDSYAELGISPEDVKRIAGKTDLSVLGEADLKKLRETFVALRDEEITLEELLGKGEPAPEKKPTLAERVKASASKDAAGAREPGADG